MVTENPDTGTNQLPVRKTGHLHPCGRPVVLRQRASKASGLKAGDAIPCDCLLCMPVESRLQRWRTWHADGYMGNYRCSGAEGVPGCGAITHCAGPQIDTMVCRNCLGLPALAAAPTAPAAPTKRKR